MLHSFIRGKGWVFEKNNDSGGGGKNTDDSNKDADDKGGDSDADKGKKEDKSKDDKSDDKKDDKSDDKKDDKSDDKKDDKSGKTFSQEELNRIVEDRLARERKKADDDKKAEEGKFKELYEPLKSQHEATEKERDDFKSKYESSVAILNQSIDAEIKDWPDSVKKLDPGKSDYEARSNWRNNAREIVAEIGAKKKGINGEHKNNNDGENKAVNRTVSQYAPPGLKTESK